MRSNHQLGQAAARGDLDTLSARIDAGDDVEERQKGTGRTPLVEAAIAGHHEIVERLLVCGADHTASCTAVGHTALEWAAVQDHVEVARVLLAHDSDPNVVSANSFMGHTPLMLAASTGHTEVLRLLLDAGSDFRLVDNRGHNALSLAEKHRNDAAVRILLEAGATPPAPREPLTARPWPELTWEPEVLDGRGSPIPDTASPAQVVWSYIRAIHAWEAAAWQALQAAESRGERYSFAAALEVAGAIAAAHCTTGKRYARASIGAIPDISPEFALVDETEPTASRRELRVRHLEPIEFVHEYEWIFFCVRRSGRWRVDSAKSRLIGTDKWEQAML